ncbi:MAG: hypothetical protein V1851_01575 [Patescibacteria group bacterium]
MKHLIYLGKVVLNLVLFMGLVFGGYAFMEPYLVSAAEATDSVIVTQSVVAGITISSPSDITLTALSLTQNTAVGSAAWTVVTNNQAGYALTIKASTAPALRDSSTSETFADYTSTGKETWNVTNAYEFGWSAYGTHVTGHGTDTDCIATADVPSATLKWEGFDGTTPIQMASSTSETSMAGTASTLCVATEQDTVFAPSGTYTATLTATATTQ